MTVLPAFVDLGTGSPPPPRTIPDSEINAFAALMQQTHIAVALTDPAGAYLQVNRRWREQLGYSEDEVLQLTVQQVTHRDSAHTIEENAAALAAGASQFLNHKKYVRKDGSVFWANTVISALRDPAGQLLGYLALISDLTAQRQGRLLVECQNEALQLVISGAPLERVFHRLIALVEAESEGDAVATISLLDPATRQLQRGAAPSLPASWHPCREGMPVDPDLATCAAAAARGEVVITPDLAAAPGWAGHPSALAPLGLRAAWSMPIISSDGAVLGTFGTYFRRCRRPSEAEMNMVAVLAKTAALAIGRVQSEARLQAAVELMERKERLHETVLANTPDLIAVLDLQYRFTYANQALLQMWGRTAREAMGRNMIELGAEAWHAEMHRLELNEVVATKRPVKGNVALKRADGRHIYAYTFCPVIGATGEVEAITSTARDVTEEHATAHAIRQARDEALASARAKDDFLAALSHELRTPLNPVLLIASDAMANPALPPEVRADFETIAHSVTLEARLIDDLLDVTRIAHNQMSFEPRRHDLALLLRRVIGALQPEAAQNRILLTCRIETPGVAVLTDEVRLQQVFWNLLKNAVKFTPPEGRITVAVRASADRPGFVSVVVTDTGIGLTESELSRVFEPFVQGDHGGAGGRPTFGGLGLGLAISQKIVALNGGFISARSAGRNRGATFLVELPLAEAASGAPGSAERSGEAGSEPPLRSQRRVLLVEDHGPSRTTLARLLRHRHFEVVEAASVQAALELAEGQPFDLVISDLGLPDGTGYGLMRTLRDHYGVPGIALSGYGSEMDMAESQAAGFVSHLTKPVQAGELERVLVGALAAGVR